MLLKSKHVIFAENPAKTWACGCIFAAYQAPEFKDS